VKLSPAHRALQDRLRLLHERGILLALISHNVLGDVEGLFYQRNDFPLRLEDFSLVDVAWDDKAAAVLRAADRLRIDVRSMIYIDDNPGELCAVAESSGIVTVHASRDATETVAALDGVAGLFRWHRRLEDQFRAEDLRSASERMRVQAQSHSPSQYLRSLQVHLDFLLGPTEHLARLAELSGKTNQFNLTLARLNEAQIARKLAERPSNVLAIRLADRLSESGIVGLVVASRRGRSLHVHELCVSCRALGRSLEDSMVTKALTLMAEDFEPDAIIFTVHKGPRNEPARQWLERYTQSTLSAETQTIEMPFLGLAAKSIVPEIHVKVWR